MYQYRPDHNAVFKSPAWHLSWKAPLDGRVNGGIAIVHHTIYVETLTGRLYAIDVLTGKTNWVHSFPNVVMTTPIIINGIVIIGTGTSHSMLDTEQRIILGSPGGDAVEALDRKNGAPIWMLKTKGEDMPSGAALVAGTRPIFTFSNGDGKIRALSPSQGAIIWEQPILGVAAMSSLAVSRQTIFGASSGSFSLFYKGYSTENNTLLRYRQWTWAVSASNGQYKWISRFGVGDCTPTIGNDAVFVEGVQTEPLSTSERSKGYKISPRIYNEVDALDAQSGTLLWKYRVMPG